MTQDEFKEWLAYAKECFTGIEPWLSRIVRRGDKPPTRNGVLFKWFLAMQDVALSAAKDATAKIHRGEIEEPKCYDRLPAAIRKAAGAIAEKREMPWDRQHYDADGNRTYLCLNCWDVGLVVCWHPVSMKAAVDGSLGQHFTLYRVAVPCTCEAGRARAPTWKGPRFDPKAWLRLDRIENGKMVLGFIADKSEQRRLTEWMASRNASRRRGAVSGQTNMF